MYTYMYIHMNIHVHTCVCVWMCLLKGEGIEKKYIYRVRLLFLFHAWVSTLGRLKIRSRAFHLWKTLDQNALECE